MKTQIKGNKAINNLSQKTGAIGEYIALKYLTGKGYTFIQKNYRIAGGEIDLILEKDDIIIFVEVKCRTKTGFGDGEEAINNYKKQKLLRAIEIFINKYKTNKEWRCDLISIMLKDNNKALIKHFPDIFQQ